jgi:hypothetical protein
MLKKDKYLTAAILLCFILVGSRLGQFVIGRVPPYSAGDCLVPIGNQLLTVKIYDNNWAGGYSDADLIFIGGIKERVKVSFQELRSIDMEKVKCE